MITGIVLKNWKSHENTAMRFAKGTNVIIGQMGSGKSSVMDAICFALFGTFPALQSRKIKLDQCIQNKPKQRQSARIEMEFTCGGSVYSIIREVTLGKGTTLSEIRKDGELVEGPNAQRVTDKIVEILKINYELFSRAVYSEQNQIEYFLQIPAGQRKRKIDELLGINKFENARKNMITLINRLKDRREDREKQIREMEKDEQLMKIDELGEEIAAIHNEIEKNEEILSKKNEDLKEIVHAVHEMEEAERKYRKFMDECSSLENRISVMKENVEEISKKLGEKLIAEDLEEKREKLKSDEAMLKKMLAEVEQSKLKDEFVHIKELLSAKETLLKKMEEEEEIRKQLRKKLDELSKIASEEKLREAEEKIKKLEMAIAQAESRISQERRRIEQLEKVGDKCPVCDSSITEQKKSELLNQSKRLIEKLIAEVKMSKSEIAEINIGKIKSIVEEQKVIEERLKSIKEVDISHEREQINSLRSRLHIIEKKMAEEEEKKGKIISEIENVLKSIAKIEHIIEMKNKRKQLIEEISAIEKNVESIKKEIERIKFDEDKLKRMRKEKELLSIDVNNIKTRIDMNKKILIDKKRLLDELKEKSSRIEKMKKEVDFLSKTIDSLVIFGNALESTQIMLREEFTVALNAALNDVWCRIYPYGDYVSLRLGLEASDYVLQLKTRGGEWINVEGIASGGERSTACLALRIAFALVLTQNLSWLVLDEPTHNLDARGIEVLSIAMREHLPELVEQIFVITHDQNMEKAVSGTLYRFERKKEEEEPTHVILISEGPII